MAVQVEADLRRDISTYLSFSELQVANVSLELDAGVYVCVAENPAGSATHAATVTIVPFVCK